MPKFANDHRPAEFRQRRRYRRVEGVISMSEDDDGYGALLAVNGTTVALVDLYPTTEGEPAQILFYDGDDRKEPRLKVILDPEGLRAVWNRAARRPPLPAGAAPSHDRDPV